MTLPFYALCLTLLAVLAIADETKYKEYDGYQLIQIIPKSAEEAQWINNIDSALDEEIDRWMETGRLPPAEKVSDAGAANIRPTQLLLSPNQKEKVEAYLKKHNIERTVEIEDLGQIVRDDAIASLRPENVELDVGPNFNFNEYHSHKDILNYLTYVAEQNKDFVKLDSIGKSFEGRDLAYVKIGYPSNEPKNAFFIDAGVHAREWITTATALHFINYLTSNETLRPLLHDIDVYVLPSLNPDGYEYSRNVDRLWRKSRTGPHGSRHCYGVDINRNFDFYWGFSGVSNNPCSEIYCGPTELSESESQALSKFLRANNNTIKAYVALHSYGNLLIHPWSHIGHSYPNDIDDIYKTGVDVANAIRKAGGPTFTVGASPEILYEVAGSSQDFAKSVGIKYAYTIELTNTPNAVAGSSDDFAKSLGIKYTYTMELTNTPYGFILPSYRIQETVDYVLPGLLVLVNRVKTTQ